MSVDWVRGGLAALFAAARARGGGGMLIRLGTTGRGGGGPRDVFFRAEGLNMPRSSFLSRDDVEASGSTKRFKFL